MLKRCFRNSLLILASLACMAPGHPAHGRTAPRREPIVITANSMEAEKLSDKITFKGDVILKKEGMTLYSDSMIVYYNKAAKGISQIDALGSVVVRKAGRVARSKKASYFSKDEKIVLTGDARIIENENQIGGERITLYMRDDRSVVEGGKVLFYQDSRQADEAKRKPGGKP